jgi:metal-responsive CopG/Arc/MetJ family transcriptional regulator
MRITVILDDDLVEKAIEHSGLTKKSQVINAALKDYVKRASQQRLAQMAGSYSNSSIASPPRRTPEAILLLEEESISGQATPQEA